MFPAPLLTLLLVFPITASPVKPANSPTSVPITRRLNFSNGTYNLVAHDIARLQALSGSSKHGQRRVSVPLTTNCFVYTISVGIGSPSTTYNLILDSGSANTWVGAGTPYQATDDSVRTEEPVSVVYSSDHRMDGIMYFDTVTVGPGLTVHRQPIGVADRVLGFAGFDGVLGIGPMASTQNTLTQMPEALISTVTDNLVKENVIPANILGVFFKPYGGSQEEIAGQLTFGGTDHALHRVITYTPIINIPVAPELWGIHQSITYGNTATTVILPDTIGIVDCGNTFISIATDAFLRYKALTGARYDPVSGLHAISRNKYSRLENLNFNIGGQILTLTRNAQIWPRALNHLLGAYPSTRASIYLIVRDLGMESQQGPFDFVIGYVFIQRFYTVFDASNSYIGFSKTQFTRANTN